MGVEIIRIKAVLSSNWTGLGLELSLAISISLEIIDRLSSNQALNQSFYIGSGYYLKDIIKLCGIVAQSPTRVGESWGPLIGRTLYGPLKDRD